MKKLTKQFKGILLVMLCVILMVPHVNANAATQNPHGSARECQCGDAEAEGNVCL